MSARPLRFRAGLSLRLPRALRRPLALTGLVLVAFWVVVAIAAPLIAPADPLAQSSDIMRPPSSEHLFGTDELGRDILSRVLFAARVSLPNAALLLALAVTFGAVLGAIAGYFGGWVDEVVMRITDLVFAFPAIVLAMVVTASLGPGLRNAVLAVAVVSWPYYARVVRGLVISLSASDFAATARLLGVSSRRTLVRDVAPHVTGPVVVLATLDFGHIVLLLASLSFLGLGNQPPTAEWGLMISNAVKYFSNWWMSLFPGLAIFSVVLAFNLLGDSLRDVLDPRSVTRDRDWAA